MKDAHVTLRTNRFHFDSRIKFENYSQDSIKLSNKKGQELYLPRSILQIQKMNQGVVMVTIPNWFIRENKKKFYDLTE